MTQTIYESEKLSFEIVRYVNKSCSRNRNSSIYFAKRMLCVHKKIVIRSDFPNEFVTLMRVDA